MKRCWILLSLLCITSLSLHAVTLKSIRFAKKNNSQQIIFDLSGAFNYSQFTLKRPERAVIDLKNTTTKLNLSKIKSLPAPIKSLRSSTTNKRLRIVLDLDNKTASPTQTSALKLKPGHGFGYRLLLELTPATTATPTQVATTSPANETGKKPAGVPVVGALHQAVGIPVVGKAVKTALPRKLRDVVIVLDAGHGGKDPGATGKRGTREKNVVLSIAKRLKRAIDKQPGMHAVLTRKGDYYISLRQRLAIARQNDADLFISIHADAFKNRRSNGASVFALSPRGATSEAARWLAEKENYSELGGVNLDDLDDKSGLVRSVLIDLSQTATINASLTLGQQVLNYIDDITSLHHSKVEQARFVVLKSPDIPSILIETGFISNPKEERNLRSSWYQRRLAKAILHGLKQYFWLHPPTGTYVEAQTKTKIHKVARGDTLSAIGLRYNVSQKSLRKLNGLKSSKLTIGQRLKIPTVA